MICDWLPCVTTLVIGFGEAEHKSTIHQTANPTNWFHFGESTLKGVEGWNEIGKYWNPFFFPHERLGVWQDFMKMQICARGKKERVKNEEASRQMRGVMRSVNPPPDHRCVEKTKEKMNKEVRMWFFFSFLIPVKSSRTSKFTVQILEWLLFPNLNRNDHVWYNFLGIGTLLDLFNKERLPLFECDPGWGRWDDLVEGMDAFLQRKRASHLSCHLTEVEQSSKKWVEDCLSDLFFFRALVGLQP